MSKHFAKLQAKSLIVSYASLALNACPQRCRTRGISKITRRGSKILQGQVSNPSERGTPNYFDPCYRTQTIYLALEEIVGARQSYDI